MKRKLASLAAVFVLPVWGVSCQHVDTYDLIPRNGFIRHYQKTDGSRMAFDSYWDISDNKDWDERVQGTNGKSQAVYICPVTLDYLSNKPQDPKSLKELQALCGYFDRKLLEVLQKQDAFDNSFHLVNKTGADTYSVRIALLEVDPTHTGKTATGALIGMSGNLVGGGAGMAISGVNRLMNEESDRGSIAMGAHFYAPDGKLVAEVADFEYGEKSLVGMVLADAKDFQRYAYHKRAIDEWVRQLEQCFTTVHEHRIRKPWFSLKPY